MYPGSNEREDPPLALTVHPGTRESEPAADPATHDSQPEFARTIHPMTEQNRDFLGRWCGLAPAMVAPYAHQLRSTSEGHLFAPHNGDGHGEEYTLQADGSILGTFTGGSRADGRGRGPSLWSAYPESSGPIRFILVAESMLSALAAAAKLDPAAQIGTRIVSTAGDLSEIGKLKLVRLIRQAQRECARSDGGRVVLMDASSLGEQGTTAQEDRLQQLAASVGAGYERWVPEGHKAWHEVLLAERHAQKAAAEAARVADPASEQDSPQVDDGPRPPRHRR